MKKNTKYLLLLTVMFTMLLTFAGIAGAKEDPFNKIEVQVYYSALQSKYPDAQCALVDLNKDGIYEYLLLEPAGVRQKVTLYTYYKGGVHKVKDFGSGSYFEEYKASKKQFVISYSDGSASTRSTVYSFNGKKVKKVVSYSNAYNKEGTKVVCLKNNTIISQKTYEKAMASYNKWSHPKWEVQPKG